MGLSVSGAITVAPNLPALGAEAADNDSEGSDDVDSEEEEKAVETEEETIAAEAGAPSL